MGRPIVILAILLSLACPAAADLTLTTATRSAGPGPATSGRRRVSVSGQRVRMEPALGESSVAPSGAYQVSDGDTWVVVDPGTRTYWKQGHVWTKTRRFIRALLGWREPRPPLTVDGIVVERLREKEGGRILGHPTRLVRCRLRFRINAWPVFASAEPAVPTVSEQHHIDEIWFAPSVEDETLRRLVLATGFPDTDEQLARTLASVRGLPLRRISRGRSRSGDTVYESTNVFEVDAIDRATVPPSDFEPPAGYRRVRWEDAMKRQFAARAPGKTAP